MATEIKKQAARKRGGFGRGAGTALLAVTLAATTALAGCGGKNEDVPGASASGTASSAPTEKVTLVLDWTPNTNHTGLYVAQEQGLWAKRGLEVEIVQPPETGASPMVASGAAEFGIGVQEALTQAREQELPLVSLAAIIQHNTSGFASHAEENIKEPKDFEGRAYGGWGSPAEQAVIQTMMAVQGADVNKVEFVNAGSMDFFTALDKDIDFEWIFYGWTGIEAELRDVPLNIVYPADYSEALDFYTPLLMTSEDMIAKQPELVRAFVEGAAEGYKYAIDNPDAAADILLEAVPELNAELVKASQKWLSPKYQDDAPRWGEQKSEVWSGYGEWMRQNGIIKAELDYAKMFTNEFLPQ